MKRNILYILAILFSFQLISFGQKKEVNTIRLFYLGGQSNMDGYGYTSDLPDSLNKQFENVWIFHGNPVGDNEQDGGIGKWELLKPGHGTGFSTDGNNNSLSKRFGIELSFAKRLQELYPNEKIAIIKYSRNGSSIDSLAASHFGSWDADFKGGKGINQYDNFLATIRNALAVVDINGDGVKYSLIPCGIIWMQGESDACFGEEVANKYYANLKRIMELIRASFRTKKMPVVIGKISDSGIAKNGKVWDYGELIQFAQEKYCRTDGNAAIIRDTKDYKYSEPWHYDSNGYIDLGRKFAEAVYRLDKKRN